MTSAKIRLLQLVQFELSQYLERETISRRVFTLPFGVQATGMECTRTYHASGEPLVVFFFVFFFYCVVF